MRAIVFPGQGSQSVGMLAELASSHPLIKDTFGEASDAIDVDLWSMSQSGPEEALNATINTQPALLAAGVAVYRVYRDQGGAEPSVLAGHSLGEYAALVCADALSLGDAAKLVRRRGEAMQAAVPEGRGGMAAIIGLDDDQVATACEGVGGTVTPANYNAPGQVVIAGERDAVERAGEAAKTLGARRVLPLEVSVPSHCALMHPAAEALLPALESCDFSPPRIPVIHNADVREHAEVAPIKATLERQLYDPVRWTDTIRTMAARGVTTVMEAGPGKVLSGLTRRIDRGLEAIALGDDTGLQKALS